MSAELVEEVGAGRQTVEQVIGFDAARRAVPVVAFKRDDDARAIEFLRNLGCSDANDASVPAVSCDNGDVRSLCAVRGFKLFESAPDNLSLNRLALAVARVQVLGQRKCFSFILRLEEFDDGASSIHSASSVDSRAYAKSKIVSGHAAPVAATCDFHQGAQTGILGLRQIFQTERDDCAVLADELRDICDSSNGDNFQKSCDLRLAPALTKERMSEFESDAHARKVFVWIVAALLIRIENAEGWRRALAFIRQVMVRDDNVQLILARPMQRLVRAYAAINADDESVAFIARTL